MKIVTVNDIAYVIRGTVSAQVAEASGGTEELKKRYNNVDTVLRNGNKYYFCEIVQDAEFLDRK